MTTVVIAQPYLPQYRAPLFNHLRAELKARDILLDVVVGETRGGQALRGDSAMLSWVQTAPVWGPLSTRLPLRFKPIRRSLVARASLVIDELAGGSLDSLGLALATNRFAAWGHGYG